jgi:hypothetical protein
LKTGVPVSWAASGAASASAAAAVIPTISLRMVRVSVDVLRDYPHLVVHHLQESAADREPPGATVLPDHQGAFAEERHERGVVRQDADLAIMGGDHDRIRRPIKHRRFRRDHRHMHQALASFFAFSTASSIEPTM